MFLMVLKNKYSTFPSVIWTFFLFKAKQILVAENLKQTVAYVTEFNGLKYFLLTHAPHILLIYE